MKTIIQIARAELRTLFYSPVAWFLGVAFFAQCAYYYQGILSGLALWQDNLLGNDLTFSQFGKSITTIIFSSQAGLLAKVIGNLYLFLPLLTMGLISREVSSGSIKLLSSSPLRVRHIVLGKYLAIVLYNIILLAGIVIIILFAHFSIHNVDFGLLLSGLIGLFFLICTYSAIGIFMSSLTSYQIVSAVAVFVMIFIFNFIGGVWQQYDFVRDLTYFLAIGGRTEKFIAGLITSKDIIYYLLILTMFLYFTMVKIKSTAESRPWYINFSRYVGAFVIVLIIGYATHRPANTLYLDMTLSQKNTIHENTQAVLSRMGDEKLKVTLYTNLLGGGFGRGGRPEARNSYIHEFWEKYLRFKPEIEFDYVSYYDIGVDSTVLRRYPNKSIDEIAELHSKTYKVNLDNFLKPSEIKELIDLEGEGKRLVMQLEYQGRKLFLRTFEDPEFWPNEMNVAAAIKRLLQEEAPTVLFATGNLERDIFKTGEREYGFHGSSIYYRYSLVNIGFDSDTINLDYRDLPSKLDYLVLADPKVAYSEKKIEKINNYLATGGNAFVLTEPGKQNLLDPIMNPLGVRFGAGTLIELTKNEAPNMVLSTYTWEALHMTEQEKFIIKARNEGRYFDSPKMLLPGAVPILVDSVKAGFDVLKVAVTDSARNTFSRVGKFVVDSVAPAYEPELGDYKWNSFNTIVGLTREFAGKEQRVLISGDADFASNLRRAGGNYLVTFIGWLNNGELPVFAPKDFDKDTLLKITAAQAEYQKYILVWIIPGLLILFGTVLLIRRKRK
jgi:ABC-2 type transport system permease protein